MNKICTKCKKEKSNCEFYKTKTTNDSLTYNCKSCYKKYRDKNRIKQLLYMRKQRAENNEFIKESKRKSWQNLEPRKKMFHQAKSRAKRKNLDFNIEIEDIIIPEQCPLLNIPFIIGVRNDYEYTYSLDRKDSTKGYVKGNIWVISKLANSMKNSANKQQLNTFAINILKYFKDDNIVRTNKKLLELENKESLS